MVLPSEHITPKMLEMQEKFAKLSPQEFVALPGPNNADLAMVGAFILTYSTIDLNLRRAIEIFHGAGLLPGPLSRQYPKISDSQLVSFTREAINRMGSAIENVDQASQILGLIDYGRGVRNLIAHFAVRRFPNEEVFIFATKNEKDARLVLGRPLGKHHILTATVGRVELQTLAQRLTANSDWIARRIPVWFDRYVIR